MELWIRSQNKKHLVKVSNLNYQNYIQDKHKIVTTTFDECYILGTYKTMERALKVLNEIQDTLRPKHPKAIIGKDVQIIPLPTYVYEMPQD